MNQILDILRQCNLVDLIFVILFFRILYISSKTGFIPEIFKVFGTVLAVYFGAHYFTVSTDLMRNRYGVGQSVPLIPLDFMDFISFIILTFFGCLIGFLLREAFARMIKMEAVPALHRWGGMVLSVARSILLMGLITYTLSISTIPYLYDRASESYLGKRCWRIVPDTYARIWYGFTSKFMSGEKFNKAVAEAQERH
jgi:uncharacterized membrane protein required for colicin V production